MRRALPLSSAVLVLLSLAWVVVAADRSYEVIAEEGQPAPRPKRVLFFGRQDADNTAHNPPALFDALREDFERFQIHLTFSDDIAVLDPVALAPYDAVVLYGNTRVNYAPQVAALVDFVEAGGGFVGIHVASWTFPTSEPYTALIGGRFLGHAEFTEYSQTYADLDPPILAGLDPYTSVDEPYLHNRFNPDIEVISWRDPVGPNEIASNHQEPYTWVRTQGLGRVFYHAGGHDGRTWSQPGFRELLARGVHWAAGDTAQDSFGPLGIPLLADDGTVAFEGDAGGAAAVWAGRSSADLFQVAQHGEASPSQLGGGEWDLPAAESPRIAGDGEVTLVAGIADGNGGVPLGVIGRRGGVLEKLLADGSPLPGLGMGISVILDPPASSPHLAASATATLVRVALAGTGGTLDDTAILSLESGVVSVVAREGDQVPSLPPGVLFGDLRSVDLSVAEDGSWAAVVPLTGTGVSGVDDSAVIFAATGSAILALREGTAIPGMGSISLAVIGVARVAGSGRVIVSAVLAGAVTPADDAALLRWLPASSDVDILLRDGEVIAGARLLWSATGNPWDCNRDGQVIISTRREGVGVAADNDEGIWFGDGNSLVPLAIEGGQVPRMPAGTVFAGGMASKPLCLGEGATAAFLAQITIGGASREALIAGSIGALGLVVAEGDLLEVGAGSGTLSGLDIASATNGSGLAGRGLVMRAGFASGSTAIVLFRDLGDLDGDAVEDSLELAFGTDPDLASDGQSGLPQMVFDAGEPALEFRRQAPPRTLEYLLEESRDLHNWSPSTAGQSLAADQSGLPAGFERVLAKSGPGWPRRFFRLRVSGF